MKESGSIQLTVKEECPLLEYLLKTLKGKSRTSVKSYLTRRQVFVNNHIMSQFDHLLKEGDSISIKAANSQEPTLLKGLRILHEDPHLIVIDKKSGFLSIATDKEKIMTAYSILSAHVKKEDASNKIFIVHRLDRDTSGVMVFAKSEKIQRILQNAWQKTILQRTYVAIVEGNVKNETGTVRSFLKENKALFMYSTNNPQEGDEAITHYKVLKRSSLFTMLEIELETGRKNQIRVHMKEMGHSVIGDKKYGSRINPIGRVGLHATVLSFIHPVSGKVIKYETKVPHRFLMLFN